MKLRNDYMSELGTLYAATPKAVFAANRRLIRHLRRRLYRTGPRKRAPGMVGSARERHRPSAPAVSETARASMNSFAGPLRESRRIGDEASAETLLKAELLPPQHKPAHVQVRQQ